MKTLTIEADRKNLWKVNAFIDEELEKAGCPMLTRTTIDVAVEEVFVNIFSYAYAPETGMAVIQMAVEGDPPCAEITLIDQGAPYDPLSRPDPDTSLSIRERKKGGLGVYMVKQSMDQVRYEYRDGKNIFAMRKKVE